MSTPIYYSYALVYVKRTYFPSEIDYTVRTGNLYARSEAEATSLAIGLHGREYLKVGKVWPVTETAEKLGE